jgi:hypothetical protein
MAGNKILPEIDTLRHWIEDEGLTHAEIAARVSAQIGEPVSRSSVSAALSRAGVTGRGIRYDKELPWRVKENHIREYPARMLRLLGRRRAGRALDEDQNSRLDSWLAKMTADDAVTVYDPDSLYGFYYAKRAEGEGDNGIPIRVQRVHVPTDQQQ